MIVAARRVEAEIITDHHVVGAEGVVVPAAACMDNERTSDSQLSAGDGIVPGGRVNGSLVSNIAASHCDIVVGPACADRQSPSDRHFADHDSIHSVGSPD